MSLSESGLRFSGKEGMTKPACSEFNLNYYNQVLKDDFLDGWDMKNNFTEKELSQFLNEQLKGIVHPKMKILSSFTHPQVVPNLYECLCSAEHRGRYSEECGNQSSSGAPLTSIVFFSLLWKSMVPQNSLVTNFLQNIFLCVQQDKEIHTGLELLEGE